MGRTTPFFPVVGIIIGLMLVFINWLLRHFLPPFLVSAFLTTFLAVVTGGLHLDGLMDTCDGLAGRTVTERWEIMHDSRVGAFGVIGAILILLLKFAAIESLPKELLPRALMLTPVISRWSMVFAIWAYPYARPEGLGKIFKMHTSVFGFILATFIALGAAMLLFEFRGIIIMLGTWVIIALLATFLKNRFAGLTGDGYGAMNEVAEVSVLILAIIMTQ